MNSPILILGPTSATIFVSDSEGGLADLTLLGQSGPGVTLELSNDGGATWNALDPGHTLNVGEALRLTRTDTTSQASILLAASFEIDGANIPPPPLVLSEAGVSSWGLVRSGGSSTLIFRDTGGGVHTFSGSYTAPTNGGGST